MRVYLKVLQGKSAGKTVKLPTKKFLIGRAENCHLRPKSDSISRKHCAIVISETDEVVSVRDLKSRNGTYIYDHKLEEETEIASGDILRVGRLEFEMIIKVKSKSQSSARRDDTGSSIVEDVDISDWLDEPSAMAAGKSGDPDTRQYRLDETERVALDQARDEAAANSEESSTDSEGGEDDAESSDDKKKKEPGKLPIAAAQSADSREAAEQMLKKFFNRR